MFLDMFVAVVATWQIVEIWHHSLLFAGLRARVELWENKLGELLGCPFCLSPWVALLSVSILILPSWLQVSVWPVTLLRVIWYAFAVSRAANLCNDMLHSLSRTPRSFDDIISNLDSLKENTEE